MKTVGPLALITLALALTSACRTHSNNTESSDTLATSATAGDSNKEQPQDRIITDYVMTTSSIKVVASDREPLGSKQPVKLILEGTVLKDKKTKKVSGETEGITIPYGDGINARLYLLLVREGDTIYTEQKNKPVARVNDRNELITDMDWKWSFTYREYRYTFHDHISALMFGTRVENSEAIFADADPRSQDSQQDSE